MSRKSIHVTYRKSDGQWHITSGNNGQSSGKFDTQKEAMKQARKQAMETSSEFCVHGKDGKIRLSTSYGNDPTSSKTNKSKMSKSSSRKRSKG